MCPKCLLSTKLFTNINRQMVSLYKAHMYCSDISSEEPTVYIFCLSFKKEWEIIFQMIQPFKPGRERVKKEPRLKRDLNLNPLWAQCKLTYERLFFRCESRSWIYFPTFSSALLSPEQIPNTELINEHLILKTDWYCLSLITIVIAIKQFLQETPTKQHTWVFRVHMFRIFYM